MVLSSLLELNDAISKSLVPKSVTTPIGLEISKQIGGLPAITVVAIGETEGAMSGLAIGIAGLITVFLVPLLLYLFGY